MPDCVKPAAPSSNKGRHACCYAKSEKSWIDDPSGIAWETFHTTGENTTYGDGTGERDARLAHAKQAACCVPEAARFRLLRCVRHAMTDRPYNVLFLCTGNSARSILAESILRKDGAGRFNAFSAGSQPKSAINPFALRVLESSGYPTDGLRSKSWDGVRGARRARHGFCFHGLRQRRRRSLSGLAGPADDGALGHRRPGSGRGNRSRKGSRVRARAALSENPAVAVPQSAAQKSRSTVLALAPGRNRPRRRREPASSGVA